MKSCIQCGAPTAEGFVTCSQKCNLDNMTGIPKATPMEALLEPAPAVVQAPEHFKTLAEIAEDLGLSTGTLYSYKSKGRLPEPVGGKYDVEAIRALEIKPRGRAQRQEIMGEPITSQAIEDAVGRIAGASQADAAEDLREFKMTRARDAMIQAAREAARDVCLSEADRAKQRGDHELRAELLDDFIHIEQGLKVTFSERQMR